jgi:hypothetical protein
MPAAPKLPASIKVGHLDFSIVLVPGADIGAYGDCHHDEQRIRIDAALKPQTMAETVVHEVLHACWPCHMKGDGGREELIVTALSPNICQVMRDNPKLFEWLSWALK